MSGSSSVESLPWYRSVNRAQWKALIASNLGWTFDGFEVFSLILTVGVALHQLLDPSEYKLIPCYAGAVIAITVFGWGIGRPPRRHPRRLYRPQTIDDAHNSRLFGADGIERAVVELAVVCACSAFWSGSRSARNGRPERRSPPSFGRTTRAARAAPSCKAGYPIGSIIASGVWLLIGNSGPGAWRYMFLVGVLPALIAFWIRRNIPKSPRWEESNKRRRAAYDLRRKGVALKGEDAALVRFTCSICSPSRPCARA